MPNYRAEFDSGEVLSFWAPNIEEAADEFYAIVGDHPIVIREIL